MAWGITYIAAGLIGFILSIYAVNKKDILGFRYFAALAFFQSIWSFCYGLELLFTGYFAMVFIAKVEYLPIVAAPILWLVFALSYTKYEAWFTRRKLILLAIIPCTTLVLVATNELHGLVWSKLELFDSGFGIKMIDYTHGSWFWVQASYSYVLFLISFVHLAILSFKSSEHYRKQIMFLMFAGLFPFFFNAVYLFDPEFLVDLTPLGFFVSVALIMWGLFYNNFYSLKNSAREAVLELMQDAVIVIDEYQTILDLNHRAKHLLKELRQNSNSIQQQSKTEYESFYSQHIDTAFPISSKFIPFDGVGGNIEDGSAQATHGVGDFTKIHVQLQKRLEHQLKEQLSTTDAGIEVLKQLPNSNNNGLVDSEAYSLEIAQDDRFFNVRVSNFKSASKQRGRVLVIQDVSAQKEQDKLIEEMVFFDKLTNLYNRFSFMQYGKLLLQQNIPVSLLVLDLDRFKNVNDSLGHHIGDDLLIQVSKRLVNVTAKSDSLARLGADEFALLTSEQEPSKVRNIAEDILMAFRSPFSLQGQIVHMNVSIGIVIPTYKHADIQTPKGARDIEVLLRQADIAMYEAKHQGLGFSVYSSNKTVSSLRNLNLETELMQAIEQSEFRLFYQPIVQAHNRELVGFEALLRWKKGDTFVGPAQFLSFAEEIGKMKLIDYWVLERVMTFDKPLLPSGFIALNLSGATLRDTGLIDLAKKLIAQGYSSEGIVLEVTESAMMNVSIATEILNELKLLGFQIAIDDFGTGYSSLSYIEQFPLDILKIDKSFVNGIDKSDVSEALLRTIINLSQNLGVVVLAEGIETPKQYQWLLENDCLYLQGHLFGWPQPVEFYKDGFVSLSQEDIDALSTSEDIQNHLQMTSTQNHLKINSTIEATQNLFTDSK